MNMRRKTIFAFILFAAGLFFLISCAFTDQETKKDLQEPPSITTKTPSATESQPQPQPKAMPPEIKEIPKKTIEKSPEALPPKATPKPPAQKPPEAPAKLSQQQYYNLGMKYYSQEKYAEAKQAWQMVVKLGKRTALANKARENIKKTDQILKTLKEISGE